jgi:uncharacterized iron-regulated membrane protein
MNLKQFRADVFSLHRYLGLLIGLFLIIAGLTGSILVFQKEIDDFLVTRRIGHIVPTENILPIEDVVKSVEATDINFFFSKLESINIPSGAEQPLKFLLKTKNNKSLEVSVNPYTAQILGTRVIEDTFISLLRQLHHRLLAGDTGLVIMGIVSLLLFILSATGIILWPGWRRLIAGFKIKWKGHVKRVNFDVHKVVGIISAVFLAMIGFTGFCFNFHSLSLKTVYAATLTPLPVKPMSVSIPGKSSLSLTEILQQSETAYKGRIMSISLPSDSEDVYRINKESKNKAGNPFGSIIYLDQYTGKVLKIDNASHANRAEMIFNSFYSVHFGRFGGLATRILYVFIGFTPLLLFSTGFVMYQHRRKVNTPISKSSPQKINNVGYEQVSKHIDKVIE